MLAEAYRYSIVGLVSIGLYVAATWYLANHFPLTGAILISFGVATFFNYVANYRWSFSSSTRHSRTMVRFAILVTAGLLWQEAGVMLMLLSGFSLMTAIVICAVTWPLMSFFGLRMWVFSPLR
jgi:putative flippase GtrA